MSNLTNNSPSIQNNQQPTLVIDLKRNCIRIHKRTLHLLGNPDYVQLMVNPTKSLIAIRSCLAKDFRSEKIRWKQLGNKQCCEFYSKYLLKSLRSLCENLIDKQRHCIKGQFIKSENLVTFCMLDSTLLEPLGEESEYE